MELTLKQQVWGDDLRLPCLINVADTTVLLSGLERYRKLNQPFQSRHLPALKRGVWFALQRPIDRSRTGLLVAWPEKRCCVYISGEPTNGRAPRVALIRVRVDPEFLVGTGMTVFAATLSSSARRLYIEDTLVWKGRNVIGEEIFSKRVIMAAQWLEHYCIADSRLLGGLELEMADWKRLEEVEPDGVWELQQDAIVPRLLWITNHAPSVPSSSPLLKAGHSSLQCSLQSSPQFRTSRPDGQTRSSVSDTPSDMPDISLLVTDTPHLVAVARREVGPDQWALSSADGVSLGRALIRKMDISAELRLVKGTVVRVEVIWNDVFKKWEVTKISQAAAAHSSAFVTGS